MFRLQPPVLPYAVVPVRFCLTASFSRFAKALLGQTFPLQKLHCRAEPARHWDGRKGITPALRFVALRRLGPTVPLSPKPRATTTPSVLALRWVLVSVLLRSLSAELPKALALAMTDDSSGRNRIAPSAALNPVLPFK